MPSPADGLRVSGLSLVPVKGLRITRVERATLEEAGLCGDRALFLVDASGRMLGSKRHGALHEVAATLDGPRLTLRFPEGPPLAGELRLGEPLAVSFHHRPRDARVVEGPFSDALSEHVGEPVRVVAFADGGQAVDRGRQGAVTLVSEASVHSLAELAGGELDPRRFRMSIELAGAEPFAEDSWLGMDVRIGAEAVIRPKGHVGRCLVTSRDPETGEIDVPTLDLLRTLRGDEATTEPLALGVYGAVVRPGEIAVGDEVSVVPRERRPRY
jgi:uncharacterized protein YcbX